MKTPKSGAANNSGGKTERRGLIRLAAGRDLSDSWNQNQSRAKSASADTAGPSDAGAADESSPGPTVESATPDEFARVMRSNHLPLSRSQGGALPTAPQENRLHLDPDGVRSGLGRLVLSLVKLLHELLERQALRQVDEGLLGEEEIDRLGLTLLTQAQEIDRLRRQFGLTEEDLNLDLGPFGSLF